jgi:hypothetical protein
MQAWLEACTLPWSSSRLRWIFTILPRRYRTQSRRRLPAEPLTRSRKEQLRLDKKTWHRDTSSRMSTWCMREAHAPA